MAIDSLYITQAQAENELMSYETPVGNIEPTALMDAIRQASRAVDDITGYQFAPSLEEFTLHSEGDHIDDDEGLLYLPKPMVEIKSLVVNLDSDGANGTELTLDTDFAYEPVRDLHTLALRRLGGTAWGDTANYFQSIRLIGYMAYRPNYRRAWQELSALAAGINDAALSFTVTTGHGARFSPGMLLRIGSGSTAELVNLTSIATDTLTVPFRGDNNNTGTSTAQAHSLGDKVYVWMPYDTAAWAARRTAALYYKRRGDVRKTSFNGLSNETFPNRQVADEVRDALMKIADRRSVAG